MKTAAGAFTLEVAFAAALAFVPALAQEAVIRETLARRMPDIPKIDEISRSPVPGLYEARIGLDIFYVDERADYIVQGSIIDTRTRTDLTRARIDKLSAFEFSALPLKDALVWKQGTGARKLAVFADPNCVYCKRFERDIAGVRDLTVYTFLYPILGGDSPQKSRDIWCSKNPVQAWRDWMLLTQPPPRAVGACDDQALGRVAALGRRHRVTGTPTLVFEDGRRLSGALSADELEKRLSEIRKP